MSERKWDFFRSTRMGDIQEVIETEACKVLKVEGDTGEGTMTIYHVFDGVYMMYNDFHMKGCYSQFDSPERLFCIDHCREGRIEHKIPGGQRYYMEAGDLRIDRRVHHKGEMDFPLCHYHGISIGMQLDIAEVSLRKSMPDIHVDVSALADKFCKGVQPYLLHNEESLEAIFAELYRVPMKIREPFFKIKVMELLIRLDSLELSEHKSHRVYFHSAQVEKIKEIHDFLIQDLSKNYTTEELAERFSISTNVLKTCFKGVYGNPIYSYIRTYKMNQAATLLVKNKSLKIGEIAWMMGYDNASKFSAAFKAVVGTTPMEYRNEWRKDFEL